MTPGETEQALAAAYGHVERARAGLRYIVDETGAADFTNASLLDVENVFDTLGVLPRAPATTNSVQSHLQSALTALSPLPSDDHVLALAATLRDAAGECRRW